MGRAEAGSGAAVRDTDGRTYAAAPVWLRTLSLTALQAAVAAAVSSGATRLEAGVVVGADGDQRGEDQDVGVLWELQAGYAILADRRGRVQQRVDTPEGGDR
ncbi:hypothetical protein [Williamsia sterculiae]|nr:hypothetical protein [Williamsia sterculiae]